MSWVYGAFYVDLIFIILIFIFQQQRETAFAEFGIIRNNTYSKFLGFLFFIPITFVAGARTFFIDTADYIGMYQDVGTDFHNINFQHFGSVEHGYLYFTCLLNRISTDPQLLFFVTAIIINYCFIKFIYENCDDAPFALLIFLCQTWTSTMNGLRQYLVAAILCIAWSIWVKKEQNIKNDAYMILIIIGLSFFHRSVLICIVVMLIARGKFFNLGTFIILVGTLALYFIPGVYSFLFETVFASDDYSVYEEVTGTMGIMRFLVCCVPIFFMIVSYFSNREELMDPNNRTNWIMNMCVFDFCCSVLALKMVFFARLGIYFSIFNIVIIPTLINRGIKGNLKTTIKVTGYLMYLFYFFYQMKAYGGYMERFTLFFQQ